MTLREIVTWPDPSLRQRCAPVEHFDEELHALLDGMREAMHAAEGLGLAANQVSVPRRVFVMEIPNEQEQLERFEIINPHIEARRGEQRYEEGCLSFPGISEFVMRAAEIDLRYRDRDGREQTQTLSGVAAVCAQHEFDHLDGITFLDRLSPLKRKLALRAYKREQRARRADERDDAVGDLRFR